MKDRRWYWLLGALLISLIRLLFVYFPHWCEYGYSRGIFLVVRVLIDYGLGWLPFPTVYLFFPLLFLFLGWGLRGYWRAWSGWTGRQRVTEAALSLGALLSGIWIFFLMLWGFNYSRLPLEDYVGFEAKPVEGERLLSELRWLQDSCRATRSRIAGADTTALSPEHFPADLETEMRQHLVAVLAELDYPTWGRVRGRLLRPWGSLLRFGATGIYWPFTGEGHVDAAIHVVQHPFTLAHEMAHGYGFGDESECNFLAYLACTRAEHPAIRYAGFLAYRRYVLGEVAGPYPDFIDSLRQTTPVGVMNDQRAIRQHILAYPEWFPKIQRAAYDFYLKSQGVPEGVMSYERMVVLVVNWQGLKR